MLLRYDIANIYFAKERKAFLLDKTNINNDLKAQHISGKFFQRPVSHMFDFPREYFENYYAVY